MATIPGLLINLTLNTAGLAGGLAKAEAEMRAFAASFGATTSSAAKGFPMIAGGATMAGLAMTGFAVASVKAATEFEYQMRMIETQAGAASTEVTRMTEAVLELAGANVQTGPINLAKGLYHIESVGIRGAEALDVLKIAAQGAAVGNAGLEEVTNALLASIVSGIDGVTTMTEAMGTLNGIVGQGNMRMQDLADSLSSGVLSTARTFGLAIQDVGAAMATMSDQGIPAEEAATRLRITIALIGAPTRIAASELKSIGISSTQLADDMRKPNGLVVALRDLKTHLEASGLSATEQAQVLKTAFGGSRSSAGILTLINSIELMDFKLGMIKKSSGSFAEDFIRESETARASFSNLRAAIEILLIRIGNTLIPAFKIAADWVTRLASNTWVLVVAFDALLALITVLAARALVGLISKLVVTFATMSAGAVTTAIIAGSLAYLQTASIGAAIAIGALTLSVKLLQAAFTLGLSLIATTAITGILIYSKQVTQFVRETIMNIMDAYVTFIEWAKGVPALGDAFRLMGDPDEKIAGIRQQRADLKKEWEITNKELIEEANKPKLDPEQSYKDTITYLEGLQKGIQDSHGPIIDTTKNLIDIFGTTLAGVESAAYFAGAGAMSEFAQGIAQHQNAPLKAFEDLVKLLQNPYSSVKEAAYLLGLYTSNELKRGLESGDPTTVAAAIATKKHIEERWQELTGTGITSGLVASKNLGLGLKAGAAEIDAAVKFATLPVGKQWDALAKGAVPAGIIINSNYSRGMALGITKIIDGAKMMGTPIWAVMQELHQAGYPAGFAFVSNLAAGFTNPAAVAKFRLALQQLVGPIAMIMKMSGMEGAAATFVSGFNKLIDDMTVIPALVDPIDKAMTELLKDPDFLKYLNGDLPDWIKKLYDVGDAASSAGDSLKTMAADAKAAITDAFSKIKDAARTYFDKLHEQNLKSIQDIHDRRDAELETQRVINQGPVDAAKAALEATRKKREWDRLQADLAKAKTPEELDSARQAILDFQMQQGIDVLQYGADQANAAVDAAKVANDAKLTQDKAAEEKRYAAQVKEFNDTLGALKSYLLRHPEEWEKIQKQILALLKKYGVNYQSAGALLGDKFVKGIESQIAAAEAAAAKLAKAGVPKSSKSKKEKVPDVVTVPGGAPPGTSENVNSTPTGEPDDEGVPELGLGAWRIPRDRYLARLHAGEMVVPPTAAESLRKLFGGGALAGLSRLMGGAVEPWPTGGMGASRAPGAPAGASGGGTIVVQIGDEVVTRIVDERLWVRGNLLASGG
jgi:TP901 family phage tail tape measure protein